MLPADGKDGRYVAHNGAQTLWQREFWGCWHKANLLGRHQMEQKNSDVRESHEFRIM